MDEITARVRRTIGAPPAVVWAALTDASKLKAFFLGADVVTDWAVGHPIIFSGEFNGKAYRDKGEILEFAEERRLSFSHYSPVTGAADTPENYHVVTFDLVPVMGVTEVTLTQSNLTGGVRESDLTNRPEFERNWTTLLEGLDRVVTGSAAA